MPSAAPAPARPLRRHTCLIARALHAVASHVPALNCSVALTVMCHACAGLAAVEHYIHISVSSSSRRLRRLAQPASQPPRSSCMRLSPCRAIARAVARSVASRIASRISPVQSRQSHLACRIIVSQPCQHRRALSISLVSHGGGERGRQREAEGEGEGREREGEREGEREEGREERDERLCNSAMQLAMQLAHTLSAQPWQLSTVSPQRSPLSAQHCILRRERRERREEREERGERT